MLAHGVYIFFFVVRAQRLQDKPIIQCIVVRTYACVYMNVCVCVCGLSSFPPFIYYLSRGGYARVRVFGNYLKTGNQSC